MMIRLTASVLLAFSASMTVFAQAPATAASGAAALPAGAGKALVQRTCQSCHGLEVVTAKRASPEDWAATVQLMVSRGADGTDEEIDTITKYLAASFPPVKDGKTAPTTDSTPPAATAPAPAAGAPPAAHFDGVAARFLAPLEPISR